jgi:hypothetical protein
VVLLVPFDAFDQGRTAMSTAEETMLRRLADELTEVREALLAQNRALVVMARDQRLFGEMMAKILEAVTREVDGGDPLSELLAALVDADRQHALILESVSQAIIGDPAEEKPVPPLALAHYAADHIARLELINERLLDVQARLPEAPR